MQRRLLLVFASTFIILLLMQPVLTKYLRKEQPATPAPQQQTAAPAPAPPAPVPTLPPAGAATKQATSEQETVIENGLYRVTFTNKGAQVKSWILKKYTDDRGRPLELVNKGAQVEIQENGQPKLIPAVERYGYPMSLWTYDETLRNKLNSMLYVPGATGELKAPAEISFEYADSDTVVRKTFQFDSSYVIRVKTETSYKGQLVQAYPAWPAGFGDQTALPAYAASRIDYQYGDKVTRLEPKKVSGGATVPGPFNWAGPVDQYFGALYMPDRPDTSAMVTLHYGAAIPKDLNKPEAKEMTPVSLLGAAVGNPSGVTSGRWFVGPKALDVVESIRSTPAAGQSVAPSLEATIDFGFFGFVGKPLFLWLKWTEEHWVANWGWAIIILTVIINVALLPLRISSMKASLKMQKIQPLMKNIQDKYKKYPMRDPRRQEMNKEVAALYKEHNVNPVGGCLPMLIQLPFLWAFYTMLSVAIELRHAEWFWIKDLSSPDPYHVLPILIVVSTYLMQKMTPTPGMDPAQARMMNIMMPVMLGVFSWAVAAGLGIYWLIGTVIAILTQMMLNETKLGKEMRAELEKRARKKALKAT